MQAYESGNPSQSGTSDGVTIELSFQEAERWRNKDYSLMDEVRRRALIEGLKRNKSQYFIRGAGDDPLTMGTIGELQEQFRDVTEDSPF
jgi:hypothetical protein